MANLVLFILQCLNCEELAGGLNFSMVGAQPKL